MYRPVAIVAMLMALCQSSVAQGPAQLVDRMAQNELSAAKNDHSYWMYRATSSDKGKAKVEEVIETPEGWMRQLISIDGKAPSAYERKRTEDEKQKFLTDAGYRRQQHDKVAQDGKKATDLLRLLPKAFIYTSAGKQGDTLQFTFRPNPGFHPPNREAKVFHAMAGTLLIDAKEMRLQRLSGQARSRQFQYETLSAWWYRGAPQPLFGSSPSPAGRRVGEGVRAWT